MFLLFSESSLPHSQVFLFFFKSMFFSLEPPSISFHTYASRGSGTWPFRLQMSYNCDFWRESHTVVWSYIRFHNVKNWPQTVSGLRLFPTKTKPRATTMSSSRGLGQRKSKAWFIRPCLLPCLQICSLVLVIRSAWEKGDSNAPMHPLQCPYPLVPFGSHCPRLVFLIMQWILIRLKCTNIISCNGEENNLDYHEEKSEWDYMLFNRFSWLLFYWWNAYDNNQVFPPKMLLPLPVHLLP